MRMRIELAAHGTTARAVLNKRIYGVLSCIHLVLHNLLVTKLSNIQSVVPTS